MIFSKTFKKNHRYLINEKLKNKFYYQNISKTQLYEMTITIFFRIL